jgi:hypothetical protein
LQRASVEVSGTGWWNYICQIGRGQRYLAPFKSGSDRERQVMTRLKTLVRG